MLVGIIYATTCRDYQSLPFVDADRGCPISELMFGEVRDLLASSSYCRVTCMSRIRPREKLRHCDALRGGIDEGDLLVSEEDHVGLIGSEWRSGLDLRGVSRNG